MKRCCKCKIEKQLSDFTINKCRKDGLQSMCAECSRIRSKNYYQATKIIQREKAAKRKEKRQIEAQKYVIECFKSGHVYRDWETVSQSR